MLGEISRLYMRTLKIEFFGNPVILHDENQQRSTVVVRSTFVSYVI